MNEPGNNQLLLEVSSLSKYFFIKKGFKRAKTLKAVDNVTFKLFTGETLGLVGESGCGKTTLGRTVLGLYQPTTGSVIINKQDISRLKGERLRKYRSDMQIVFQDPYSSLNPRMTVGKMLNEILSSHMIGGEKLRKDRIADIITKVGLEPSHLKRYPHEFSGGQRQRIAIARALILYPKLIVADEPSSALDMSIQAQILNLLKSLQKDMALSYLFITHNLSAAKFICDRIAVMYLGKLVEIADSVSIFKHPLHPYTKALISLCPVPDPDFRPQDVQLRGEVPSPVNPPKGCPFHPRCPESMEICKQAVPMLNESRDHHQVSCFLYEKVDAPDAFNLKGTLNN